MFLYDEEDPAFSVDNLEGGLLRSLFVRRVSSHLHRTDTIPNHAPVPAWMAVRKERRGKNHTWNVYTRVNCVVAAHGKAHAGEHRVRDCTGK